MKKYLSHEAKCRLKKEFPTLFPRITERIVTGLKKTPHHRLGWIFIILITLGLFFFAHFINIETLNFIKVESHNVKSFIESRTANIVTLISITFAIVGFLISNLAIKSNKSYDILFRRTFFLPIAYFSLTLMGAFIALTAFKDHLNIETLIRIVYFGVFLLMLNILFIGLLFSRLIVFTNSQKLYKMVCEEFYNESRKRICEAALKEKSKNILNEETNGSIMPLGYGNGVKTRTKKTVIKDVYIKKLHKIISRNKAVNVQHNDITLGKNIEFDKVFFEANPHSDKLIQRLNKTAVLSNHFPSTSSHTREYLTTELIKLVSADDYSSVGQILESYGNVVKIHCVANPLILEIIKDVKMLISKAVETDSINCFNKIDEYVVHMTNWALKEKQTAIFNQFIGLAVNYYTITNAIETKNQTSKFSSALAASRIQTTLWIADIIAQKQTLVDKTKEYNDMIMLGYTYFSNLLYQNIYHNDFEGFTHSCQHLDSTKMGGGYDAFYNVAYDIKSFARGKDIVLFAEQKMSDFYHFCCKIGIKYWLYSLYFNGSMDRDTVLQYLGQIRVNRRNDIPTMWQMELLFSKLNSIFGLCLFNWSGWQHKKRENHGGYSVMDSPLDWIFYGYAVDLTLANGAFEADGNLDLSYWGTEQYNRSLFIGTILERLKKVKQNISQLHSLFDNENISADFTITQFEKFSSNIDATLAKKDLDLNKIKQFSQRVYKDWKDNDGVNFSFNQIDVITFAQYAECSTDELCEKSELHITIDNGRRMFVDDASTHIDHMDTFVTQFRNIVNDDILNWIINSSEITTANEQSLDSLIKKVIKHGYTIIAGYSWAYKIDNLVKDIDVRMINGNKFKDYVIIANITDALDITMHNTPTVDVKAKTLKEAESMYDNDKDYYSNERGLTQDEAIVYIMDTVEIDIKIEWESKIKNKDAFTIVQVKSDEI